LAVGTVGDLRALLRRELRLERIGDGLRDLALDREDVLDVAVVALRPQVVVGGGLDQLHVDVHLVAGLLHAALENRGDAELHRDGLEILGLRLVALGRGAGNDLEVADAGQAREDLVLHAAGEVLVGLVLAQVLERQHGDRLGRRRGGRVRGGARGLLLSGQGAFDQQATDGQRQHHDDDGVEPLADVVGVLLRPRVGRVRGLRATDAVGRHLERPGQDQRYGNPIRMISVISRADHSGRFNSGVRVDATWIRTQPAMAYATATR
jgi:hypothetical protein